LLSLLCLAMALPATGRWVEFRSGPFEVLTDAGDRQGRDTLNALEQFRHTLGNILGEKELQSVWPVRILAFRSAKDLADYSQAPGLFLGRDAYTGAAPAKGPLPPAILRDCTRILIASNMGRLPDEIEAGLASLFSTLDVDGARVTLGQPPPPADRDKNWARMHMLAVTSDYYGKLRVLLHNLAEGVAAEPAYRNAFGKSPAQIDKEAGAYLQAASFTTLPLSGRVIRAEKEFAERQIDPATSQVALADLLLGNRERSSEARAAYEAILKASPGSAEAHEGLGLLALRSEQKEEARKHLVTAMRAESKSARAHVEYARLEPDPSEARAALEKAIQLNPRWAEAHFELARLQTDAKKTIEFLATAARLDPRNTGYWRQLAEACEEDGQFAEAAKAWAAAELSAPSEAERAQLRQVRADADRKRWEQEEEEKRRKAEEERRELERLKQEAIASIEAALAEANREAPSEKPGEKREVVEWWDAPVAPAKVEGVLGRVDCLGKQVRLVIEGSDRKQTRLLIRDLSQVAIRGGGQLSLGCGPQRPPRKVIVEYFPKPDAKLNTAGEAAVIDFPE
jgi:tetratricopeptide (TPR) repeat protein